MRKVLAVLGLACLVCGVDGCPGPGTETDPGPPDIEATPEAEPNGTLPQATAVVYDASGRVRLTGSIETAQGLWDTDYYALGALAAGDRVVVDVNTPASQLDLIASLFDAGGQLFTLNDDEWQPPEWRDPYIDEVVRHDSDGYYLVLARYPLSATEGGAYEVVVTLERGGPAPTPRSQTVLLDFTGGPVTIPDVGQMTIAPFDAGAIDGAYSGQTETVKQRIVETVRQNYTRFNVIILDGDSDTPAADGVFSRVYFGGYDPSALGKALNGTDVFNADQADEAIVFTGRFTPDLFTDPPDASQLGLAIGTIAAHEIGHLLGLNHVRFDEALMNGYDAPDYLLTDQEFMWAFLDWNVLGTVDLALGQDAVLLLSETVGWAPSADGSE